MYIPKKIASHAPRHIDDGQDEITGGLNYRATRIGKGGKPSSPGVGQAWWNPDNSLSRYNGTSWIDFIGGGAKPSPSVVVAASDSLVTEGADYICDGAADQVQINQAIQDAASVGGWVHLMEGAFELTDSIVMESSVQLSGCGHATKIDFNNSVGADVHLISAASKSDFLIRDLFLDEGSIPSGGHFGISLSGCSQVLIERCRINNFAKGVKVVGSDRIRIARNRFHVNGESIETGESGNRSEHIVIAYNNLSNSSSSCINLEYTDHSIVRGNYYSSGSRNYIRLAFCEDMVVYGNNMTTLTDDSGVQVRYSNRVGIRANVIREAFHYAVSVGTATAETGRLISIDGNVFTGVPVLVSCDAQYDMVSIVGNVLANSSYYGIDLRDTWYLIVALNVIRTSGYSAIISRDGGAGRADNNYSTFFGNCIFNNGRDGIHVKQTADRIMIIGNSIRDVGGGYNGIRIESTALHNYVQLNLTEGYSDEDAADEAADTTNNNKVS